MRASPSRALAMIFGCFTIVVTKSRLWPSTRHNPEGLFFRVHRAERALHRVLRLSRWKGRMPSLTVTGFDKSHLDSLDRAYLYRFAQETCHAEVLHLGVGFAGLIAIPRTFDPPRGILARVAALLWLMVNLMYVAIQRFNRPRILALHRRRT